MRRLGSLAGIVGILAIFGIGPASAQYGGGGTTTSSSSTTSTTAAEPVVREQIGQSTPEDAHPGATVTFTSPAGAFQPGSTVDIVLMRSLQGAPANVVVDNAAVTSAGNATGSFDLANTLDPGVYTVYAEGTDENGDPIRVVSLLVVLESGESAVLRQSTVRAEPASAGGDPSGSTASSGSTAAAASTDPGVGDEVIPPPEVRALQQSPEVEAAILDEVAHSDATVAIDGNRIVVTADVPAMSSDSNASTVAAGAVAAVFVGGGLLALRRRRASRS